MNNRFYRNRQRPTPSRYLALKGCLIMTLGLAAIACSETPETTESVSQIETPVVATEPEIPSSPSEEAPPSPGASHNPAQNAPDSSVYHTEVGNDGEPNEPLTANIERLNLQPGTPYGDVRSLVMAEGWVPYTQADGATPDINTLTVQEMHNLGFEEAQACSGTGQGFCAFEFVHINRDAFPEVRLVIITTPAMGELYGEPNFYDWRIDNYEPEVNRNTEVNQNPEVSRNIGTSHNREASLNTDASSSIKSDSPNFSFLEANATYETEKFDAASYADVLAQEQDCVLIGDCANSRYLFEDVLLVFNPGEFGSITMAVIPHAPVVRTQALNYAQILDTEREIDFADSLIEDNNEGEQLPEAVRVTESFFEADLPADGVAYERGSAKMVRLISQPGQPISRIEFAIVVF